MSIGDELKKTSSSVRLDFDHRVSEFASRLLPGTLEDCRKAAKLGKTEIKIELRVSTCREISQGTYWTNEQAAEAVLASLHSKLMAEQIFSGAAECDEHGIIYSMRVYW